MKKRVSTLRTLIAGKLPAAAAAPILQEFDEVMAAERTPVLRRRWLLQVLHSTRGLDTALFEVINALGHTPTGKDRTLGGHLHWFSNSMAAHTSSKRQLPQATAQHYQHNIVHVRNRFMHKAGEFPQSDAEIAVLLSEMHSCIAEIVAL